MIKYLLVQFPVVLQDCVFLGFCMKIHGISCRIKVNRIKLYYSAVKTKGNKYILQLTHELGKLSKFTTIRIKILYKLDPHI